MGLSGSIGAEEDGRFGDYEEEGAGVTYIADYSTPLLAATKGMNFVCYAFPLYWSSPLDTETANHNPYTCSSASIGAVFILES